MQGIFLTGLRSTACMMVSTPDHILRQKIQKMDPHLPIQEQYGFGRTDGRIVSAFTFKLPSYKFPRIND